ncbi:MAG: hypothetical protein FJ004_07825 [Chloroflexi bacterium]|nr:hypothetical protein [Chloroflexota bacterium]
MANDKEYEQLYQMARGKLEGRAFYVHFVIFLIFNSIIIVVWRFTGISFPWFVIPLGFWSIFILFHYLVITFLSTRRKPSGRMEKAIEFEIWKMKEEKRQKASERLEEIEKQKAVQATKENDKQSKSDTNKPS